MIRDPFSVIVRARWWPSYRVSVRCARTIILLDLLDYNGPNMGFGMHAEHPTSQLQYPYYVEVAPGV